MELTDKIARHFDDSARLKMELGGLLASPIASAAGMMVNALLNEKKILVCGNGGSAALAQYFAARMLNHFEMERPGLATIALPADNSTLTSIANGSDFSKVFSKQVSALGQPGDILIVMSNSGNSANILAAIKAAHERDMQIVAMSGGDGGELVELLSMDDIHIGIPHGHTARIQEVYLLILHCLCDAIDCLLLGAE